MNKTPPSAGKIVLMVVAVVLAIGFAVWNIGRALSPPAPAARSGAKPGTAAPAASGTPSATAAPAKPAAAPAVGTGTAAAASAAAPDAGQPAAPRSAANTMSAEASLAPDANPFVNLPAAAPQAGQPAPAAGQLLAPVQRMAVRATTAPASLPAPAPVQPLPPLGSAAAAAAAPAEPQLSGTLLGERPSAVFSTGKSLEIVPVGGVFQGWKVVAVNHGGAVLRMRGRTLRLSVGGSMSRGTVSMATPAEVETRLAQAAASGRGIALASASDATPDPGTSWRDASAAGSRVSDARAPSIEPPPASADVEAPTGSLHYASLVKTSWADAGVGATPSRGAGREMLVASVSETRYTDLPSDRAPAQRPPAVPIQPPAARSQRSESGRLVVTRHARSRSVRRHTLRRAHRRHRALRRHASRYTTYRRYASWRHYGRHHHRYYSHRGRR